MSGVSIPQYRSDIGDFVIGESVIGGFLGLDYTQTILSQYANSQRLLSIIDSFSAAVDPSEQINNFYDQVFNLETAEDWGLDVWGRIVGVNRVLAVTPKFFGFSEAGNLSADPFNVSPFYSAGATFNFPLLDDAFRYLIYAKCLANLWDGSIFGLNQILLTLLPGRGNVYVIDNQDMTMTVQFDFVLTPVETAVITTSGVLPHPAGVALLFAEV